MAGIQIDGVNNKIDFDDDADTSISSATDDTLVVEVGGSTLATATATSLTINDGVTITTADNTTQLQLISTDADSSGGPVLDLFRNSSSPATSDTAGKLLFTAKDDGGSTFTGAALELNINDVRASFKYTELVFRNMLNGTLTETISILSDSSPTIVFNEGSADLDFRVESNGNVNAIKVDAGSDFVCMGKNTDDGDTIGHFFGTNGAVNHCRSGANVMSITRNTDDGSLMNFRQGGQEEGSIGVSGSTVTYATFTGSHWSRLADNSKPTILRGTIMDSIDEMCDWYQAVADVAESTDEDGNVIPAHKKRESISLPEGKSVGDAVTFTSNGVEYTGVYEKETDVKHVKCKISDTGDSKKAYGVFHCWNDADDGLDGDVNDMEIAQVGTYIIRINKDVTVEAGDLLVSNGDGTAKLQDDDIIRSKTVAKVNSTVKIETYADGSYTVPCTLHC